MAAATDPHPSPDPAHDGGHDYNRDDTVSRWLDWAVRIAVVISFAIGGWSLQQVLSEARCQGEFNTRATAVAPALTREREAQRATDRAESLLWVSVKPGETSPAEQKRLQTLFSAYQATLGARSVAQIEADRVREENPLPTCNGPTQ